MTTASTKPSKREATRARVIAAAIDCIYQDGFNAAHTNRIAEAAGVSWGVLQYHFGDKDGLLQAVLDHIFEEFLHTLGDTPLPDGSLHDRVRQMIDVVWSLVSQKEYRVSVAILRNAGKDDTSSINGQKQIGQWARKTSLLWDSLLEGSSYDQQRSEVARHLLFATLRGLADEINPQERGRDNREEDLVALADAISHVLRKD